MKKALLAGIVILSIFSGVLAQEGNNIPAPTDIPHSVPLENIIFDDFDSISRALPYTEATVADIERLRDRITPLCNQGMDACLPVSYEDAYRATMWLRQEDMVIGYIAADGQPYSYPFKILNYHEIVNDTLADVPILISYCPLCNSAVVYSRLLDEETLIFGNTSALYNSDMVMYDTQTESYWFQVEGRAIAGELTDAVLTPLPATVTTWKTWATLYPDTLSLERPRSSSIYERNPFIGIAAAVNRGDFLFPVDDAVAADDRLPAATNVLVVQSESSEETLAFPMDTEPVMTAKLDGNPVLILSHADGTGGAAFSPVLTDGTAITLRFDGRAWVDAATGSEFNIAGTAISGELEGTQLQAIPSRFTFWFAAVASHPEIQVAD